MFFQFELYYFQLRNWLLHGNSEGNVKYKQKHSLLQTDQS